MRQEKVVDRRSFLIRSAKGIGVAAAGLMLLDPARRVFAQDREAKALLYVPYRETPHIRKYYETL